VNSYSQVELEKFDQWVRMRLEECQGDDDCFELVWEQILQKIGDPSRKMGRYGIKRRLGGFLDGAQNKFPGASLLQRSMGEPKSGVESEVMLRKGK
jgi:hypothetical protein